ncbi:MAG TPA: cache domain-containing protein, partial [Acidobacteriota bacterium]|nr:cache domain-containing protein [Acidobacteriota bacterium]
MMSNLRIKFNNRFRAPRSLTLATLPFKVAIAVLMAIAMPLATYMVWNAYHRIGQDAAEVKSNILQQKKILLRLTVEDILSDIYFRRAQAEQSLRQTLIERVYQAHAMITRIHREFSKKLPGHDVQQITKEALRGIRFAPNQGYYFAASMDGNMELFADRPHWEGKNLVGVYDSEGRHVIKDMINLVSENGEGFYQYAWTKPNTEGRDWPKISFVKEFTPYNWMVGTGEYLDDVDRGIQQEILLRIKKFHSGRANTLMVFDSNGRVIADAALFPDDVRAFVEDVDDSGQKRVEKVIRNASIDTEGSCLTYLQSDLQTGEIMSKMAYFRQFKEWGWTVVSEVRLTHIEDEIAEKKGRLASDLGKDFVFLIAMILFGGVLAMFVGKLCSFKLLHDLKLFSDFLEKSEVGKLTVDTTQMVYSELIDMGGHVNDMMGEVNRQNALMQKQANDLRNLYRALDQAPVSVVITDSSGQIEYVNPKFTEVTGYSLSEAVGQNPRILNSGHQAPEVYAELWNTITNDRVWSGEFLNKHKSGTLFWEKAVIGPVTNEDRIIVSFVAVKEDITERKQIEEKLRRSEARYRAMFDEAGDGILIRDRKYTFMDANNRLLGMLGYTLDEFKKLKTEDLIHPEDLVACPTETVSERVENGETVLIERRYRRKRGSYFPVELSVRMVDPDSGIVQSLVRDITERIQTERLLQTRMRLLEYAAS